MKKKDFISLVLILCVPALLSAHHLLDSLAAMPMDLFLLEDFKQDLQWYVKDMGMYLSRTISMYVLWNYVNVKIIKSLVFVLFIFSIFDIVGYWICFLQYNHIVMTIALAVWLIEVLIFFIKNANEKRSDRGTIY